ncbi:hypothetical protein NDU88_007596 [Pleurodeles waltl]|uniref:Uncharacterized protein n=1 Tax=Pleurodeles waltl TaxID=8319 RepID=A0AAV7U1L0_PLEWA|nr:hypothetical protein NDU88_007596 [Pleurodeles waltl]
MDRMSERIGKQAKHLEVVQMCVSEAEDEQATASTNQKPMDKVLLTLQDKTEDSEARSHSNNLIIWGLAKSTNISNKNPTWNNFLFLSWSADIFVVEHAQHSLAPHAVPQRNLVLS